MPIDNIGSRAFTKLFDYPSKDLRQILVVGIEIAKNVPCRVGKSLVEAVCGPLIGLKNNFVNSIQNTLMIIFEWIRTKTAL